MRLPLRSCDRPRLRRRPRSKCPSAPRRPASRRRRRHSTWRWSASRRRVPKLRIRMTCRDAYRKTADTVARSLFVGEVRVPAKSFGEFLGKVRAFGDQSAAKAGAYANLQETGSVSTYPFFSAPKDRTKVYDLSK